MDPQNQVQNPVPPQPNPQPATSKNQKRAGLILISLIGVVLIITVLVAVLSAIKKSAPTQEVAKTSETSSIKPQTEYDNPFDKTAQYVNPFSSYKNPFDSLK